MILANTHLGHLMQPPHTFRNSHPHKTQFLGLPQGALPQHPTTTSTEDMGSFALDMMGDPILHLHQNLEHSLHSRQTETRTPQKHSHNTVHSLNQKLSSPNSSHKKHPWPLPSARSTYSVSIWYTHIYKNSKDTLQNVKCSSWCIASKCKCAPT